MWREIEQRNYAKSLDHQGILFKTTDRKTTSIKHLVGEIETILREQKEKRSSFAGRYQLDFVFRDAAVFEDAFRLVAFALENVGGEETRIREDVLKGFVMPFFAVEHATEFAEDEGQGLGIQMEQEPPVRVAARFVDAPEERKTLTFYANTNLYAFLRLYQVRLFE